MMTTNYTHIFNANLDMFYSMDDTRDEYEYSNGLGWSETEDGIDYEDDYDGAYELLDKLEREMAEIVERCGVYGAEEYAEVAAFYSDVYKDVHGFRPSGIGLLYHGISA